VASNGVVLMPGVVRADSGIVSTGGWTVAGGLLNAGTGATIGAGGMVVASGDVIVPAGTLSITHASASDIVYANVPSTLTKSVIEGRLLAGTSNAANALLFSAGGTAEFSVSNLIGVVENSWPR
jgi:hypothetical protein